VFTNFRTQRLLATPARVCPQATNFMARLMLSLSASCGATPEAKRLPENASKKQNDIYDGSKK